MLELKQVLPLDKIAEVKEGIQYYNNEKQSHVGAVLVMKWELLLQ